LTKKKRQARVTQRLSEAGSGLPHKKTGPCVFSGVEGDGAGFKRYPRSPEERAKKDGRGNAVHSKWKEGAASRCKAKFNSERRRGTEKGGRERRSHCALPTFRGGEEEFGKNHGLCRKERKGCCTGRGNKSTVSLTIYPA